MRLFTLSAAQDNAHAYYNLANIYVDGQGVEKDYKAASEYYIQAIEFGHEDAAAELAELYKVGGFGLKKDLKKARELLED